MKHKLTFLVGIILSLALTAGVAQAQIIGGVIGGYGQVVGAQSSSEVAGLGGTGASIAGISGTTISAQAGNISGAQALQGIGSTTVLTESLSTGGMTSATGSLGLASGFSGGGFGSTGGATGIAGQGILGGIGAILP